MHALSLMGREPLESFLQLWLYCWYKYSIFIGAPSFFILCVNDLMLSMTIKRKWFEFQKKPLAKVGEIPSESKKKEKNDHKKLPKYKEFKQKVEKLWKEHKMFNQIQHWQDHFYLYSHHLWSKLFWWNFGWSVLFVVNSWERVQFFHLTSVNTHSTSERQRR